MTNAKQRRAKKLSREVNKSGDSHHVEEFVVRVANESKYGDDDGAFDFEVGPMMKGTMEIVDKIVEAILKVLIWIATPFMEWIIQIWENVRTVEYLDVLSWWCMVWKQCGLFTLCLRISRLWELISGIAAANKQMLTKIRELQPVPQSPQQWLEDNTNAEIADKNYRLGLRGCGHFQTGLPNRSVTGRLVTHETVQYGTGLVELPGFLTEKECDILLEEMNSSRANLCTERRSEDVYTNGKRNRSAVTSTSIRLPSTSLYDCDEKLSRPFARLMKMVEPFVTTVNERRGYQYGVIKQYAADRSDKVGITLHNDSSAYTLIIYLNTVPEKTMRSGYSYNNGCTTFPHLGLSFYAIKGNAVWFRNHLPKDYAKYGFDRKHRTIDFWLAHIGEPVTEGKKTIVQIVSC